MKTTALVAIVFVVSLSYTAFATSDEAACGTYSYREDGLSLQFTWKLDGIHDLRLNEKEFSKVLPIDSLGRYGSTGLYQIEVPSDKGRTGTIQLFVLFDEDEKVREAAGFYIESSPPKKGSDRAWSLDRSAQLRLRFKPISPEECS